MNLVKWFRKNNTKVMAVVVIVLMIGFIGGSALTMLLRGSGGADDTVAYFGKNGEITPRQRGQARSELELLQAMGGSEFLLQMDLRGLLLNELLFSGDRGSGQALSMAKQAIQRYGYRISDKQLRDLYQNREVTTDIYWLLLREEARDAGIYVSPDQAGQVFGKRIVPGLFGGRSYGDVMQSLVSRYGLPENAILGVFGNLLAVLQYTEVACSTENVTTSQIKHLAKAEGEMLNADLVQFKASYFVDKDATPSQTELTEQFNKYKDTFAGDASESNPYGFGYKLLDRVQVEYVALQLEDVKAILTAPTNEEMESYYRENRKTAFTEQVNSDPNDPNSAMVDQIRPYAEVVDQIAEQLMQEKIARKANQILLDIISQANAGLEGLGAEREELSLEALKKEAGNFETIEKAAESLSQEYGVELYSGRTGLLNPLDMQDAKYLSRLALTGRGDQPIFISQLMFALETFGDRAVTLVAGVEPQMYEMVGPLEDPMAARSPDVSDKIMAAVRIVRAEPAAAPESLDTTYSTKTLRVGSLTADQEDETYSVKEKVVEDVKVLAAWETTKNRAQEFKKLAAEDSWENASKKFNEQYGAQATDDPNDPNVFDSQNLFGLRRISADQLNLIATQRSNVPGSADLIRQLKVRGRFVDRLFAQAPDKPKAAQSPKLMEFKPEQSFYCIKSLTVNGLNQQQFKDMKGRILSRQSHTEIQSLAAVHLNPQNIIERMDFKWSAKVVKEESESKEEAGANEAEPTEEPSEDAA